MKKNRAVAFIWIGFIVLLFVAIIVYLIYANINQPYFGSGTSEATTSEDPWGGFEELIKIIKLYIRR